MGVRIESIRWLLGGKPPTEQSQFYVQHQNRNLAVVKADSTPGLSTGEDVEPAPLASRTIKKMGFKERLKWSCRLLFASKDKWRECSFKLLNEFLKRDDQESFNLLFIKLNQLDEIPVTGSLGLEMRQLLEPFLKHREKEKESLLINPESSDSDGQDLRFAEALDRFELLFDGDSGRLEIMEQRPVSSRALDDEEQNPYHDMIVNALARGDFDAAHGYIKATQVNATESLRIIVQEAKGKAKSEEIRNKISGEFPDDFL